MLEPTKEEKIIGHLDVRETYKMSKLVRLQDAMSPKASLPVNTLIRVIRDGIVIFSTRDRRTWRIVIAKVGLKMMRKRGKAGLAMWCQLKTFNDIKEGDSIEGYEIIGNKANFN